MTIISGGTVSLEQAKEILGPIVCHYSRKQRRWTLHQKPSSVLEIIAEARRWSK
jgi:hypothetical protein